MKWNRWPIPVALLLLGTLSVIALILTLVGIQNVVLPPKNKYGLVFDAGSSHTSLFVYQWPGDKENNTGMVSQFFMCQVQGPGISSYVQDPAKAGASLKECLDQAMAVIPQERQREAPAYLGATAGMRLLRQENSTAADQVMAEVSKTIRQYPVNFKGAQIIPGKDEGAYGWITINYLLESFTKYSIRDQDWIHPSPATTLGSLDLGGASTQISFLPAGPIQEPAEAADFRLYGYDYSIYTHSYLCYGQNQALQQLLRIVVNLTNGPVDHPCYSKGYEESVSLASIYSGPCNTQQLSASEASMNVTLVGTGNATLCREKVRAIFNSSDCPYNGSCGFNQVYQPKLNGKFLAFAAYYYTFNFLNLTETYPLATVEATIQTFCGRTWNDLRLNYPNDKYLKDYCARAYYILTLLLDGYGFTDDTWTNIAFRMTAANSDIGWTLGYMLNLTNLVPTESRTELKGHEKGVWVAAIFFIVLILALCLVLLLVHFLR